MNVHLGQWGPSPRRNARNSELGSKTYDYVREYHQLKKWALRKFGEHDYRAFDDSALPRIPRGEAVDLVIKWGDASKDIIGAGQLGTEVWEGLLKMQVSAYGSADAAKRKKIPQGAEATQELTSAQAAYFWEGMSEVATSIGAAKLRPTWWDKTIMVAESIVESVDELPGRVLDQGKKIGEGIEQLVTVLKWTGVISGGLLAAYLLVRILPDRPKRLTVHEAAAW